MGDNDNSAAETKLILEEWKTVIQTQMHFNDMIMKMRTTAVSIVLAVFGASAYHVPSVSHSKGKWRPSLVLMPPI